MNAFVGLFRASSRLFEKIRVITANFLSGSSNQGEFVTGSTGSYFDLLTPGTVNTKKFIFNSRFYFTFKSAHLWTNMIGSPYYAHLFTNFFSCKRFQISPVTSLTIMQMLPQLSVHLCLVYMTSQGLLACTM